MSIATAITNAQNKVAAAYTAVSNKGGTLPQAQNLSNLATAINSISGGGGSSKYGATVDSFLGDVNNGELEKSTSATSFNTGNTITSIGDSALYYAFYDNAGISSVSMPEVTEIKQKGLECAFSSSNSAVTLNLSTVSFPKLTTIGNKGMQKAFFASGLSGDLSDFSKVTSVGYQGLLNAFSNNPNLSGTVNFSSLTTISQVQAFYYAFQNCNQISSINFNSLQTISGSYAIAYTFAIKQNSNSALSSVSFPQLSAITGIYAFAYCFQNCNGLSSLSFPALTSTSFGSYTNQFNNMLKDVTGCTVHFPSNLQSVIGGWTDVTAGFGGTNTTVLFDLTATT